MMRQSMECKKIFTNYATDGSLISRIYKESNKQNIKPERTIKKWAEDLNRNFSSDEIQMVTT